MDLMKTLLAYMAATLLVAVQSTATPTVTPEPTPGPEGTPVPVVVITEAPPEEETPTAVISVTPAPVPTISPNPKYHNLAQGDKGDEVRRLQEKLIELGYLPAGSADGAYGRQTRYAVRRFQYYNGLAVDGVAGRSTQTNLFENPDVAPYPGDETAAPDASPTVTPVSVNTPEAAEAPTETPEVTEAPTETPEVTEAPTETPEATEAPAETPEATEAPAETPEATEAPAETPEATEAPTEAPEATEVPEETPEVTEAPTETPVPVQYEDLAGWIVLNDSGGAMQWNALEDGVTVLRSPRLQASIPDRRIRVSLSDVVCCMENWTLTVDPNTVVLEAAGYTIGLYNEEAGPGATVDGQEIEIGPEDFDFETEAHFVDVEFLTRALRGSWTWDEEEQTLLLQIPGKALMNATD